jgi:hypothetical protein
VVVAPDTGPMHIAVAVGTPTIGLFGYTNPRRAGPYRFRELTIDAFGEPGESYDAGAGYRPGRMDRITVAEVLEKVELALNRYADGRKERGGKSEKERAAMELGASERPRLSDHAGSEPASEERDGGSEPQPKIRTAFDRSR